MSTPAVHPCSNCYFDGLAIVTHSFCKPLLKDAASAQVGRGWCGHAEHAALHAGLLVVCL